MGIQNIAITIAGIVISLYIGATTTPAIIEQINVAKSEVKYIDNQKIIFDSLQKFISNNGRYPNNITELIPNYLPNDIEFQNFNINIDNKGLVQIKTPIEENSKDIVLKSNKSNFSTKITKEFDENNEEKDFLVSSFLLPIELLKEHSNLSRGVNISNEMPSVETNKYWYDTSNGTPILKFSDGENWIAMKDSDGASKSNKVYNNKEELKSDNLNNEDLKEGDIKYAFDSSTNSIQEFVYYNNNWVTTSMVGKAPTHYTNNPYLDKQAIKLGFTIKENKELILCNNNKHWCLKSNPSQVVDGNGVNNTKENIVAIEESYSYINNNCNNFIQDYGSIKDTNKCKITTNAYIDTEAINLGRALQNNIFLNKCNSGKHWCKEDGTLIDKDLTTRKANVVVNIGIPTYAGYYRIPITKQPYNSKNVLANQVGIANWNNELYTKSGKYWYKTTNSQLYIPCYNPYSADTSNLRCYRTVTNSYGASYCPSGGCASYCPRGGYLSGNTCYYNTTEYLYFSNI